MTGPDYRVRIPKLRRLGRLWGFIVVLFLRRFYNGPMGIIDNKKIIFIEYIGSVKNESTF